MEQCIKPMIDSIFDCSTTEHLTERRLCEAMVTYKENMSPTNIPNKKLAVLSCMDTRLTELLPAALGLKNGDAKIIKNAGGLVLSAFDSAMRSILVAVYELGVEEIMVVAHSNCGACHMSFKEFEHHMVERGISASTLSTIKHSGIDLDQWLEGFHDTEQSVHQHCGNLYPYHPLLPQRCEGAWFHYRLGDRCT